MIILSNLFCFSMQVNTGHQMFLMSKKFSLKYISLKGYICKVDIKTNTKQDASETIALTVMLMYDYYKSLTSIIPHSSSGCPIWGMLQNGIYK